MLYGVVVVAGASQAHLLTLTDMPFCSSSLLQLLARLVKNHGHFVDEACDGREAVAKVAAALEGEGSPYDTILMGK